MHRTHSGLNGWQRIGIVASVVWAIGAPLYMRSVAETEAMAAFDRSYDICRNLEDQSIALGLPHNRNCMEEARLAYDREPHYDWGPHWADSAMVAFVPV